MIALFISTAFAVANTQQAIDAINQARYDNGLSQIYTHGELTEASFHHSRDMASRNFFSHYNPDGFSPASRAIWFGFNRNVSEVIHCGISDASRVVGEWLRSHRHRSIILASEVKWMGVSHYWREGSDCGDYWTVKFGW